MTTKSDGGSAMSRTIESKVIDDGYHTIQVSVTLPNGIAADYTRNVCVQIKPVKVTIGEICVYLSTAGQGQHSRGVPYIGGTHSMWIEGDAYPDDESKVKTCIKIENDSYRKVQDGDNACRKYCTPEGENSYVYLTEKDSTFYFYTNVCRCTYMETDLCKINRGNQDMTRTLSSMKPTNARAFSSGDINSVGDRVYSNVPRGNYQFSVTLSDD